MVEEKYIQGRPRVATIGFFDGVHRGHRFLIGQVMELAHERSMESLVVTFDRSPRQVLAGDFSPCLLTTAEEKCRLLLSTGITACEMLHFTPEMASLSARDFMRKLHDEMDVDVLLVGYDSRFGHGRTEGFADYVRYGEELGMEVLRGKPYAEDGVAVSSSSIRTLLQEGRVAEAARCLSVPYTLEGHVVHGEHIGTDLGFPTVNLRVDSPVKLIPAHGVYAVTVSIKDRQQPLPAMLNIGHRPTFDGRKDTIEAHILDFEGNLYGQSLSVAFVDRLRDERRFGTKEALVEQLGKDAAMVRKKLNLQ